MTEIERGTQIIYVPRHANGDIEHKDAEAGFVTSVDEDLDVAFCRFWSPHYDGELRTKANSEACNIEDLVVRDTYPQFIVDEVLEKLNPPCRTCNRECRITWPACECEEDV